MRITPVEGKRVTLMGLGHFGGQVAAARFLAPRAARVMVTDSAPADQLADSVAQLAGLPLVFRLGEHEMSDFTDTDLVVTSPAVPPHSPFLTAARQRGIPVVTEIELFLERLYARCPEITVIGVTGTKGKSTSTALLGRMLATRFRAHVGGNIGASLLNAVETIQPTDLVLLELSSYMLHYLGARRFRPQVALVTYISEDHVKWHGSLAAYHDAKRNLVRWQLPTDTALLCGTSEVSRSLARDTAARVHVFDSDTSSAIPLLMPGVHNQLNAQGALLAAELLGVPRERACAAVADFPGLPHRLELVAERDGVRYYNDSIATVPEAAQAALASFPPGRVILIVGGSHKPLDYAAFCREVAERAKAAICIGQTGPGLAGAIGPSAHLRPGLPEAVDLARTLARPGDIVLLSPATASYDQYPNFQVRGDHFRTLANA